MSVFLNFKCSDAAVIRVEYPGQSNPIDPGSVSFNGQTVLLRRIAAEVWEAQDPTIPLRLSRTSAVLVVLEDGRVTHDECLALLL